MSAKNLSNQTIAGVLAMAATAFLWSIAGLFIKVIDWNPFLIAGLRSLIASLVILIYLRRPQLHLSMPQLAAGIANAITMLLFVSANKTTTAANAILLQYITPVSTAFISAWILRERPRIEHWAAISVVSVGLVVMFMDKVGGGKIIGDSMALLSGITFSLFFVFMRMQKNGSPLESILLSHWITAAIGLMAAMFFPLPRISLKSVLAISVLGIFQVGLSAILFSAAIKRISAISASLIAVIEPVFNPLWVFIVLAESPSIRVIIGGTMILSAVTAASLITAKNKISRVSR